MTVASRRAFPARLELLAFGAILVLAAVLRLVDLPTRGTWDADQGHDMLVLSGLIHGQFPLLGPPTSIGAFHHGVLYYVVLAPAALVSGADPIAVTGWIAVGGILAVAVTGWLARSIAGSLAGLIAALLMAVSASAVEESIFIWNPNLVALSSSIALAAAWHAWQSRRARWWVVAGLASVVTMHCHVLGAILTPVIAALLVADVRRRRAAGDRAGVTAIGRAALGWLAIGVISYVPLLVHELATGGSEIQAALAFVTTGGGSAGVSFPARVPIVALRVLGWPLTGLITAAPAATFMSAVLVGLLALWRGWLSRRGAEPATATAAAAASAMEMDADRSTTDERTAVRWLSLGLVWTIVALTAGASGLATVIPGLPNDHYHAFADPMVVVIVAIGLAALVRAGLAADRAAGALARVGPPIGAGAIVLGLVAWNLVHQPPRVVADGGWPAAQRAAARVIDVIGSDGAILSSLPVFKSDEALRFPLQRAGVELAAPRPDRGVGQADSATPRVVLCDQLFSSILNADCGGTAEDRWVANPASNLAPPANADVGSLRPILRFEASPGRWISIYRP
ncbi:MAG: glycosyltransferase family 39 protein [Chloroflexota bacterium]|nr:glycosyltransferase family 39 protein [Chloroflexota bacterium]